VVIATLAGNPNPANYGAGLAASVVLGVLAAGIMLLAERWRPGTVFSRGGVAW